MAQAWQQSAYRESPEGYNSSNSLGSLKLDTENNYMQILTKDALENISVSNILKQDNEHSGFLYKRAQEKVTDHVTESVGSVINTALFSKWQLRYVVLYHEYVLYFKNDRSLRPKGVFSLRGYNRVVRAEDMTSANQQWAFKIIGLRSDYRTWYFGAASEREMRLWMAFFKVMMEKAIHGKARDKSLRILQDLKYNETKFLLGKTQTVSSFEPGIYEDIEEPLESKEEDYLPPCPSLSIRQLPTPPRKESQLRINRGPLPVIPPRPDMGRRESTVSSTSTDDGEYIQPQEVDEYQAKQLRSRYGPRNELTINLSRPIARQEPAQLPVNEQRQGPDGNSFRKKIFQETPHGQEAIQNPKVALKPVVPLKPKPGIKHKPPLASKPVVAQKPKPPAFKDFLPATVYFNSADKKAAEGLLLQHSVDGMYLLRLSSGPGKVLMVYHQHLNQCKHYKVFGDGASTYSLNTDPICPDMQELLQYYSDNPLPNTSVKLSQPYRAKRTTLVLRSSVCSQTEFLSR